MKKVHMKRKCTVFHANTVIGSVINIPWEALQDISKFYYNGYKLCKIKKLKKEIKQSLVHISIITNCGEFKETVRYQYSGNQLILLTPSGWDSKQPPAFYNSGNDFLEDLNNHKLRKIDIMKKAAVRFKKMQESYTKEMDTLNEVLSTVEDYPEEFI
jgi:hypothetical protein